MTSVNNEKEKYGTKFENITPDKFAVENGNYGQVGCVIFRPNFKYTDGDSFRVDVDCTDFAVSYDVNFFNLKCTHNKELIGKINSFCIKKGKIIYFCDKCGIIEEPIALEPHQEQIISYTRATCQTKGRKRYKCSFCLQIFDEEIDIQPHDYILREMYDSSKTEGTCRDCFKKIQFYPPTSFKLWYKKENEKGNFSCEPPYNNPVGSIILVWVDEVNGDKDYNEMIFEVSNPALLKLPSRIINDVNALKVIGAGNVRVTCYPKYNPSLKKSFSLTLG